MGLDLRVNWISVLIFAVVAIITAYLAQRASGGWSRPWMGLKPLWWFGLIFLVPWIGLPILGVQLLLHRRKTLVPGGRASSE